MATTALSTSQYNTMSSSETTIPITTQHMSALITAAVQNAVTPLQIIIEELCLKINGLEERINTLSTAAPTAAHAKPNKTQPKSLATARHLQSGKPLVGKFDPITLEQYNNMVESCPLNAKGEPSRTQEAVTDKDDLFIGVDNWPDFISAIRKCGVGFNFGLAIVWRFAEIIGESDNIWQQVVDGQATDTTHVAVATAAPAPPKGARLTKTGKVRKATRTTSKSTLFKAVMGAVESSSDEELKDIKKQVIAAATIKFPDKGSGSPLYSAIYNDLDENIQDEWAAITIELPVGKKKEGQKIILDNTELLNLFKNSWDSDESDEESDEESEEESDEESDAESDEESDAESDEDYEDDN